MTQRAVLVRLLRKAIFDGSARLDIDGRNITDVGSVPAAGSVCLEYDNHDEDFGEFVISKGDYDKILYNKSFAASIFETTDDAVIDHHFDHMKRMDSPLRYLEKFLHSSYEKADLV